MFGYRTTICLLSGKMPIALNLPGHCHRASLWVQEKDTLSSLGLCNSIWQFTLVDLCSNPLTNGRPEPGKKFSSFSTTISIVLRHSHSQILRRQLIDETDNLVPNSIQLILPSIRGTAGVAFPLFLPFSHFPHSCLWGLVLTKKVVAYELLLWLCFL